MRTTKPAPYFVVGYNAIIPFVIEEHPNITDDEQSTRLYINDRLQLMIAHEKYMVALCEKSKKDRNKPFEKWEQKHYQNMIDILTHVYKNHTIKKEGDTYYLTLPFIHKLLEDNPKETREYNDGVAIQFMFDAFRKIGMCFLMRLKITQDENINVEKYLPTTLDEWEHFEKVSIPEADYWLGKSKTFRIVAVPRE